MTIKYTPGHGYTVRDANGKIIARNVRVEVARAFVAAEKGLTASALLEVLRS